MWGLSAIKDSVSSFVAELNEQQEHPEEEEEHEPIQETKNPAKKSQETSELAESFQKISQDQALEIIALKAQLDEQKQIIEAGNASLASAKSERIAAFEKAESLGKELEQTKVLYRELKETLEFSEPLIPTESSQSGSGISSGKLKEYLEQIEGLQMKLNAVETENETSKGELIRFSRQLGSSDTLEEKLLSVLVRDFVASETSVHVTLNSTRKQESILKSELDDLKKSQNTMAEQGKKVEEQYGSLLSQHKRLQAECREAFEREDASKKDSERIKGDLKKMNEVVEQMDFNQKETERYVKTLERQAIVFQEEVSNKQTIAENATRLLDSKIVEWSRAESAFNEEIHKLQKDLEAIYAENNELHGTHNEIEGDYSSQIQLLEDTIGELKHQIQGFEKAKSVHGEISNELIRSKELLSAEVFRHQETTQALTNLQGVLERLQKDFDRERAIMQKQITEHAELARKGELSLKEADALRDAVTAKENAAAEIRKELKSTRKYIVKLETENGELRKTVQATLVRLDNFSLDENMVDRRMVNQLLVAYVEGKRSRKEVLELMSKILQFSDEEKAKIGIHANAKSSSGMFGSLFSYITPSPVIIPEDGKTGNLGDMWVDFLLSETEDEQHKRKREKEERENAAIAAGVSISEDDKSVGEADDKDKGTPVVVPSKT